MDIIPAQRDALGFFCVIRTFIAGTYENGRLTCIPCSISPRVVANTKIP